jgi:hypothetical protein
MAHFKLLFKYFASREWEKAQRISVKVTINLN